MYFIYIKTGIYLEVLEPHQNTLLNLNLETQTDFLILLGKAISDIWIRFYSTQQSPGHAATS